MSRSCTMLQPRLSSYLSRSGLLKKCIHMASNCSSGRLSVRRVPYFRQNKYASLTAGISNLYRHMSASGPVSPTLVPGNIRSENGVLFYPQWYLGIFAVRMGPVSLKMVHGNIRSKNGALFHSQ